MQYSSEFVISRNTQNEQRPGVSSVRILPGDLLAINAALASLPHLPTSSEFIINGHIDAVFEINAESQFAAQQQADNIYVCIKERLNKLDQSLEVSYSSPVENL